MDRIKALWSYQTSERFTDAERAAHDPARLAGLSPNLSEPDEQRKTNPASRMQLT